MSKIIVIHASDEDVGGIVNATLFYGAALIAAGRKAEIWTASIGLANRARVLDIPVFYHPWFKNAGLAIISPKIIPHALAARTQAVAVMHQGEKLWLFGRIWLSNLDESVVFHNNKINQRRLFRRWLALSTRQREMLNAFATEKRIMPIIRLIRNGPLRNASVPFGFRERRAKVTIGCLGNFCGYKGVDILIRAFGDVVRRGHDLKLILAGDGPERTMCQKLAEDLAILDRIEWPGWLENTEAFFNSIDLFCLPSRWEPFGIVITEAMQAGLPVVATFSDGPSDIVLPGKTGWLVPSGNVEALSQALEEAVSDPAKMVEYGKTGYQRFESNFSLSEAGEVLIDALDLR